MEILPDQILALVVKTPGLSDRELTIALRGINAPQQPINQAARSLASHGLIVRQKRGDGVIGNYATGEEAPVVPLHSSPRNNQDIGGLSEDEIKKVLEKWLSDHGWNATIAIGKMPGIDIDAYRGNERWIIEVKGAGSRPQMRVNYFLCVLGETLQRMDDPIAKYSIALPDFEQYRRLWDRLPFLVKSRTQISVLFVSETGAVVQIN